jgi:peptide/nickel transport system substrate-binding protein
MKDGVEVTDVLGELLDGWSRRQFIKRVGAAALSTSLFGGLVSFLEACASGTKTAESATPVKGGHLVEALRADPVILNGVLDKGLSDNTNGNMFDGLLGVQPNGDLFPLIAKSLPTISTDQTAYTFTLRQDVKWSDGVQLTADDVVFTYKLMYHPDYAAVRGPYRGELSKVINSVIAPDKYTVVIKTNGVSAPFLANHGWHYIYPQHTLGSLTPAQFMAAPFNQAPSPVSGPFKFVEWVKGDHITLMRNDSCYRGAPYLDKWVMKTVPDTNNNLNQLKTGEIDCCRWNSWGLYSDIVAAPNLDTDIFGAASGGRLIMNIDPSKPAGKIFGEKAVRQALGWAINRQGITDAIYFKKGAVPGVTMLPPISFAFNPNPNPKYGFDLKKAADMLDAAGWKVGASGIREKNGVQMKFEIQAPVESPEYSGTAQILEQDFKKLNIAASTKIIPFNKTLSVVSTTRDFDAQVYADYATFPDPDLTLYFASQNAAVGGLNAMGYKNSEVDSLLAQAASVIDHAKRKEIYFKIQDILNDDAPSLPISCWNGLWVRNKRVKNYSAPDRMGPAIFNAARPMINKVWVTDGK